MGLDTTHDAFHGAYSAFNSFRRFLLKSIGGSFPPHEDKDLLDSHWYWRMGAILRRTGNRRGTRSDHWFLPLTDRTEGPSRHEKRNATLVRLLRRAK